MGAELSFKRYEKRGRSLEEIIQEFKSDQKSDLYENGHSYSGGIGMLEGVDTNVIEFKSSKECVDYIYENHDKWESAIITSYKKDSETYYIIGGWCSS